MFQRGRGYSCILQSSAHSRLVPLAARGGAASLQLEKMVQHAVDDDPGRPSLPEAPPQRPHDLVGPGAQAPLQRFTLPAVDSLDAEIVQPMVDRHGWSRQTAD